MGSTGGGAEPRRGGHAARAAWLVSNTRPALPGMSRAPQLHAAEAAKCSCHPAQPVRGDPRWAWMDGGCAGACALGRPARAHGLRASERRGSQARCWAPASPLPPPQARPATGARLRCTARCGPSSALFHTLREGLLLHPRLFWLKSGRGAAVLYLLIALEQARRRRAAAPPPHQPSLRQSLAGGREMFPWGLGRVRHTRPEAARRQHLDVDSNSLRRRLWERNARRPRV